MTYATHPKAALYLRRGIFDGIKSFGELEARISALATVQERGDAFEVFAEVYFATVAVEQAKQVWPGASVPPSLRKRLALTSRDMGVDGVFETQLGEHHAYQVKFRTGRPSLIWDDLSKFIGQADRVDRRALITNCDRFADVVKERTAFYAITGNYLDKLKPQDFAAIHAWLAGKKITQQRKTPLPHQAEALTNILAALRENDRATALMACGTGKTLVALWVAERMGVRNILVLVPSLALLGQTLHEWARETSWPALAHLCVCSDPAVQAGSDEIILRSSDLDFPIKTESKNVRKFLATCYAGVRLVFSTYQSAHVVAAGMPPGAAFDLAIFDEAHKTAGREGVHFGFALSDKNLAIKKRLFLTATPRHYDLRKRDKEGDARLVYSMDAPQIYGPVAHQLTFAEAARRGIICHYRVIISVVTSGMVNDHLLRHGEVLVQGDAVQARHVASQLALQAAVAEHGAGKIFTFHRSVASAAAFTGSGAAGIGNHLPGFAAFHVNGTMPMSERNGIMREFRAAPRAVISNARCLTEGVDVPAVDMVAFLTPKRSRVDIVQATGRAMRKAEGKTTGYVLVPLFVEQAKGETIEQALARTEFDEIWNVLQAMQEQDETLATAIKEMCEERGRTKGFDDARFREAVEILSPQLSLDVLRHSITTTCIERLGGTWEERYGQLIAFKQQFGHCNVEVGWKENPSLGAWVSTQRLHQKKGTLGDAKIRRLDELGFVWDYQKVKAQETWDKWYRELEAYTREHGNPHVPKYYSNTKLASWVWIQRQRRNGTYKRERKAADLMTPEQENQLNKLGFRWYAHEEKWSENFEALKAFKVKHGHCEVGVGETYDEKLASWARTQRILQAKGELLAERKTLLDRIGFNWAFDTDRRWREMYDRLKCYHAENGDTDVPGKSKMDRELAQWVGVQRQRRKSGTISDEEIQLLNDAAFSWKLRDVGTWEDRLAEVATYKAQHGHCDIPLNYQENPKLGRFVQSMRAQRNRGKLSAERIAKLEMNGFVWASASKAKVLIGEAAVSAAWKIRFDELLAYKKAHGDCNVPAKWSENEQLGNWVGMQRQLKKQGKLAPECLMLLEENGFIWQAGAVQKTWEERFADLLKFKDAHGNCDVPKKHPDDPALGVWVIGQRHNKKRGRLAPEHERLLSEAGFTWEKRPHNL